jgi:DNA polymerase/3'-5' exonuclease PolX
MENRTVAQRLLSLAHSLEEKHASFYRVQAYRRAAETVLGLEQPVEEIVACQGPKALRQLPGIGPKMSARIETLVRTAEITTLKEGCQGSGVTGQADIRHQGSTAVLLTPEL